MINPILPIAYCDEVATETSALGNEGSIVFDGQGSNSDYRHYPVGWIL